MNFLTAKAGSCRRAWWCASRNKPECPAPQSTTSGAPSIFRAINGKSGGLLWTGHFITLLLQPHKTGAALMPLHSLPDSAVIRMSVLDWDYRSSPHRSREATVWCRKIGNPRVEKVLQHRLRRIFGRVMKAADVKSVQLGSSRCGFAQPCQNKGAASLTKAPSAFRQIGEAVNRQGTLTIIGSQRASGY